MWPDVFSEPIDAPYRPEITDPLMRRGAAIADALAAWSLFNKATHPKFAIPLTFASVLEKLGSVAESGILQHELAEAAAQWRRDREEANHV